jgi:hypothetical protein
MQSPTACADFDSPDTIITSFPRRWGRNKPDPSGVHKSLRERLENTPEEEIQSVYDLGTSPPTPAIVR